MNPAVPVDTLPAGDVVDVRYRLTSTEYIRANLELAQRSAGSRGIGVVATVVGALGILMGTGPVAFVSFVLGLIVATGAITIPFAWYQARRRPDLITGEMTFHADAAGLHLRAASADVHLAWDTFRRVHETSDFLFLDTAASTNHLVPKRAFDARQLATMYRLIDGAGLLRT